MHACITIKLLYFILYIILHILNILCMCIYIFRDHTVRKRALHNLPPWQAKWLRARSLLSLPPPCSLPGTWGCKSWIIVPSSLSLPDSHDIQGHELRLSPAWHPKAVKEDLCSGDKMQSACHLEPDFGPHVSRCPLLCSLLIPPQPLPIPLDVCFKTRPFSLINGDLDRNDLLGLRFSFLSHPIFSQVCSPPRTHE